MSVASFIGEVARPFAVIITSASGSAAMIITSLRVENGNDGALLIGAIGLIVTGIYLGKAVEVWKTHRADADVKIAEANNDQSK